MTLKTSERCVSSAIRYFLLKAFDGSQIQWGTLAPPCIQTLLVRHILFGCLVNKCVVIVSIAAMYILSSLTGNDFVFVV